jgi:hypothetical protein
MFEAHKEKKALEKAAVEAKAAEDRRQAAVAEWTKQVQELQFLLAIASGNSSPSVKTLMLKKGEIGVAQITGVGLVEERKGPGQWKGSSQAVSFPIGKVAGRTVRYRVGGTKGHYVQGAAVPTQIDVGTMTFTSQRIAYQGSKRSVECAFPKLLGIQHHGDGLTISVSNRQKPTVVYYGSRIDDWVTNRLNVALSLFNGDAESAKAQLRSQIAELESSKPVSAF